MNPLSKLRNFLEVGAIIVTLLWVGCKQPAQEIRKEVIPIRVEVLNGSEEAGLARLVTDFLRRGGFDVVNYENAESSDFLETIVADRSGDMEKAQQVAQALGVQSCIQQIKRDPYRIEDVLVIIGRDFGKSPVGKNLGR